MAKIRVLAEDDVPGVARLFARVYPAHGWNSQADCERYFHEMLFGHPWRELDVPSWVAEANGAICGLYAVQARRMLYRERPLRVAVGCQYMVDPAARRSPVAIELAKACLAGPQDLTLADGASDQSRRMWRALGGRVPLLYAMHWLRLLRPARYALSLAQRRAGGARALAFAARPLAPLADAAAARLRPNRFLREDDGLAEEALDPAALAAQLPELMTGCSLRPVYDASTLAWLLSQAARKTRHGRLRARAVRDGARRLVGWYAYYLRRGDTGEVLQIAARHGSFDAVLRRILADAWRHGAAALGGRLDPRHASELAQRHCWFLRAGTWTLAHTRDAELAAAIERGEAFITRLEGEWWMRFVGG